MSVVAKFKCHVVKMEGQGGDAYAQVRLEAVTADTEENKTWAKYTPCGGLTMAITNPAAFEQFEEGAIYRLTLEKVEDAPRPAGE